MWERNGARCEDLTPLAVQHAMRCQMANWALANNKRTCKENIDLFSNTVVVIAVVPHQDSFSCFPIKGQLKLQQLGPAAISWDSLDQKIGNENSATFISENERMTITAIACGTIEMARGLMRIAEAAERKKTKSQYRVRGSCGGLASRLGHLLFYAGLLCGALLFWMFYSGHAGHLAAAVGG
jgi:hypothetical protein